MLNRFLKGKDDNYQKTCPMYEGGNSDSTGLNGHP